MTIHLRSIDYFTNYLKSENMSVFILSDYKADDRDYTIQVLKYDAVVAISRRAPVGENRELISEVLEEIDDPKEAAIFYVIKNERGEISEVKIHLFTDQKKINDYCSIAKSSMGIKNGTAYRYTLDIHKEDLKPILSNLINQSLASAIKPYAAPQPSLAERIFSCLGLRAGLVIYNYCSFRANHIGS